MPHHSEIDQWHARCFNSLRLFMHIAQIGNSIIIKKGDMYGIWKQHMRSAYTLLCDKCHNIRGVAIAKILLIDSSSSLFLLQIGQICQMIHTDVDKINRPCTPKYVLPMHYYYYS